MSLRGQVGVDFKARYTFIGALGKFSEKVELKLAGNAQVGAVLKSQIFVGGVISVFFVEKIQYHREITQFHLIVPCSSRAPPNLLAQAEKVDFQISKKLIYENDFYRKIFSPIVPKKSVLCSFRTYYEL